MSQFILFSCNKKKSGLHDINPEFSLRKVVIVILELPFVIFLFHGGNKNTELRWKLTIQRKKSELHNINSELLDVNNSDFFLTIMKKTIMKKKIMKKIKKNKFYIFKYFFHFLILWRKQVSMLMPLRIIGITKTNHNFLKYFYYYL